MFLQIANCDNPKFSSPVTSHDERIGVVESDRIRHSNPCLAQLLSDEIDFHRIASLENFLNDRPGVFGVEIDLAAAKRLPDNNGPPHSLTVLGGNSGVD